MRTKDLLDVKKIIAVFIQNEKGSSSLEYVLLITLIMLGSVLGYSSLGSEIDSKFEFYANMIDGSADSKLGGGGTFNNAGGAGGQ